VDKPTSSPKRRRIVWANVATVSSAAILIAAELFGGAFAGGWAIANLLDLGPYGAHIMQALLGLASVAVMVAFFRSATRAEPFVVAE
jgi:hypothetical protein